MFFKTSLSSDSAFLPLSFETRKSRIETTDFSVSLIILAKSEIAEAVVFFLPPDEGFLPVEVLSPETSQVKEFSTSLYTGA